MIIREIKRGQRGGVKRKDNKERSFQYQFVVAVFSMLGFSNTTKTVIVLSVVIVPIILINISYILYHLYMKKKTEFSNRLLNVLYSDHFRVRCSRAAIANFRLAIFSSEPLKDL